MCSCVTLSACLMDQVHQSVPDVYSEAVVSQSDLLLLQIHVEHRFAGYGQFALFFLSENRQPAGSHEGVLVPHQLHSGQIWGGWRQTAVRQEKQNQAKRRKQREGSGKTENYQHKGEEGNFS